MTDGDVVCALYVCVDFQILPDDEDPSKNKGLIQLDTEEAAVSAIKTVNGLLLHGKYM